MKINPATGEVLKNDGPPMAAFDTLCGGALPERLEHELRRLLDNIADPNTEPDAKRELHVVFKFKPNRDRDAGDVEVQFKPKLAPMVAANGRVYLRIANGKQVAIVDTPPEQGTLFTEKPELKAVPDRTGTHG